MAKQDIGSRKEVGGQRGHTKAQAPVISLSEPGRLRVAHVMALFAISHSTLYPRHTRGPLSAARWP